MTNRREKRLFWILILGCGLVLAALPVLLPGGRYPVLNLSAGGALIAAAIWRLSLLRRRRRREPWNPET